MLFILRPETSAALLAIALVACSGEVIEPSMGGAGASSTTANTTKPSPTTDTTPTSTGSGGAGAGGASACVPQGGTGGTTSPTCSDLFVMNVTSPVVADDSGDGKLSYLETATVTVKLNEIEGVGFNWYPGVFFSSDTVSIPAPDNSWFYAILPCESYESSAQIQLLTALPKGTTVTVKAQVGMLNADCPDAPSIMIPIQIE